MLINVDLWKKSLFLFALFGIVILRYFSMYVLSF